MRMAPGAFLNIFPNCHAFSRFFLLVSKYKRNFAVASRVQKCVKKHAVGVSFPPKETPF